MTGVFHAQRCVVKKNVGMYVDARYTWTHISISTVAVHDFAPRICCHTATNKTLQIVSAHTDRKLSAFLVNIDFVAIRVYLGFKYRDFVAWMGHLVVLTSRWTAFANTDNERICCYQDAMRTYIQ